MVVPVVLAQQKNSDEVKPQTLVHWMRSVNTLEYDYKASHGRFADVGELLTYANAQKPSTNPAVPGELSQASMQPYVLQILTTGDGSHYSAKIDFPSDMHNKSTWCKTAAFSDDSGLISLGQNIQCSATAALGASSSPGQ